MFNAFLRIAINRDFNPISGHKTNAEHRFQCKYPILFSRMILFILCTSGVMCIGIYGGIESHFESLESDPFASAIQIEGSYSRDQLEKLKSTVLFDVQQQQFIDKNNKNNKNNHCIPVFEAIYPFNMITLWFMDAKKKNYLPRPFDVFTVRISDSHSASDHFVEQWVKKHLQSQSDADFFSDSTQTGMILSKTLFNKLGFSENAIINSPKNTIGFLDISEDENLIEDRIKAEIAEDAPLTEKEIITDVITVPLVNIAEYLPGGNAIITEGMYYNLTRKGYFNPCKSVEHFYLKNDSGFKPEEISQFEKWVQQNFDMRFFKEFKVLFNNTSIKLQFSSEPLNLSLKKEYRKTTAKCQIRLKVQKLSKQINQSLDIDFCENIPTYYDENDQYYNAFLYINRNPLILNKIKALTRFLRDNLGGYILDHQAVTLKNYQQDMNKLNWLGGGMMLSIVLIIFFYISVTFILSLQTKMHKIGIMMAMGASSKRIRRIYIIEALITISIPLILSMISAPLLCYLMEYIMFNFSYAFNWLYLTIYVVFIMGITFLAILFAGRYVFKQWPGGLISYQT